jgi:hypothetical protein
MRAPAYLSSTTTCSADRSYAEGSTAAILARLDRGYAASGIRTSENSSSTTLVNKGKKRKGGGCYYAPALTRYAPLPVRTARFTR